MYKNLLKVCALAILAASSIEGANGMDNVANDGNANGSPNIMKVEVKAYTEAHIEANIFGNNEVLPLLDDNINPKNTTIDEAIKNNAEQCGII